MSDLTHFSLLAASLRSRAAWDEFEAAGEAENSPEDLLPFIVAVREFYATDPSATSVDEGLLTATTVGVTRDPKRRETMQGTLAALLVADVSVPNARAAVRALRARRVGEALATRLLLPSKDGPEAVRTLLDEYIGLQTPDERDDAPQWALETLAPAMGTPRIPVYPRSLGSRLRGGLWPGHHMTVFARPEIGKTAFALTIAVMAAANGKARVLYCTNEDSVRDLMLRALALFNRTSQDEVLRDLAAAIETARKYGAERILFRDMAPGSLAEVDRLARRYKPDLLVVDQMRNMGGGKAAENMTQRLDAVAQGLRNVGKRHGCAVLSLTQAGDSARDKAILDDGDVDNSNTGISAGCDVLIGIGATQVMQDAGERRLCIIKNKLGGTHGYADVRLDPVTLAFRDHS